MHNIRKENINVLITSAGREVPLVKAFRKALAKKVGMLVTVDINPLSAAFHYSDISYLVPRYADSAFVPVLMSICKRHSIKLLIPTKDDELPIFSKNKGVFAKAGTIVMVANVDTVDICYDKFKFAEFCEKNKIPVPKIYTMSEAKSGDVQFPLFINDRFGKGSRSAFKVANKNELCLAASQIGEPIVQEFIDEKEYSVDLFSDFEGNVISVVPRERIYTFGGESFIGKTLKNKKIIDASVELSKKLGLIGHNTIQCFFDGRCIKFIEVNPRYGGGANLGFAAGADTPSYLIQLLKGKRLRSKVGKFKENLIMLRHTEDIFIDAKDTKYKKIRESTNF